MPAELTPLLPLPVTRLLVGGASELNTLVAPLVRATQHPASLQRLLHQAGWDVEALLDPEHYAAFAGAVDALITGVEAVFGGSDDVATAPLDVVDIAELGAALGSATAVLLDLARQLEPTIATIFEASDDGPSDAQVLATQFVGDIADVLAVRWLSNASPLLFSIARFAGLVTTVRRPSLYLTPLEPDDEPDSDSTSRPLPIRWPVARLGINSNLVLQPFLLGLQSLTGELSVADRQTPVGIFRAIGDQLHQRIEAFVADLSSRPIGVVTVVVDVDGMMLTAPNWLPTADAGFGDATIEIPLNDHATADVPLTLDVESESVRFSWSGDTAGEGVVLIADTLTLLERFTVDTGEGEEPAHPGIELAVDANDLQALTVELVVTVGLRLDIGPESSTELVLIASASWDGSFGFSFRAEALGLVAIPLVVPGLTGMAVGLDRPAIDVSAADLDTDPRLDLEISVDAFTLSLPSPLFRAVTRPTGDEWSFAATSPPMVTFTPGADPASVGTAGGLPPLLSLGITDGQGGGIDVDRFELLDLGPNWSLNVASDPFFVGVGGTINNGVIIDIDDTSYTATPGTLGELAISRALVHLPPDLPIPLEEIVISDALINEDGFSGEVAFVFAERPDNEEPRKLFGAIPLWFRSISLVIEDNLPTEFDLKADVEIPYFDEIVELSISFDGDFNLSFRIETVEPEGITLTKEELLLLNFKSAEFDWNNNDRQLALEMSGGIEPLLWNADGLEWPRLDVTELRIEQDVQSILDGAPEPPIIRLREAWLDLKELATLDLFGFHFELNRLGMGYLEDTDELWVDLTGSLRLIELIPVGLGVEGFRITWPRRIYEDLQLDQLDASGQPLELTVEDVLAIASRIQVKFDGIHLFFGVPQAVEFEGFIRFIKTAQKVGFAGDMMLRLPSTGLAIEAGLMVGMNFAEPAPYPFLYVYFGILLPSGIPLGQSGLALKGAKGLFGLNVEPDREPDENPYYDWYQRGPIEGAHPTSKWRDKIWSIAFGAGITITTADGKILGVQGLLALVIPGPIIFVEGKALIFDGVFPGDSPLKALGYFDGNELTTQLNIEASMELVEGVIDVVAGVEAFFDFRNLLNWHLYAGVDEPLERRIRADVLKLPALGWLFQADAYLMIDMPAADALGGAPVSSIDAEDLTVRARMGVYIGFKPPTIDLVVASAEVHGVIDGEGLLTINPFLFSGSVGLDAVIDVDAFSLVKVRAEATANMSIDGALPLVVDARVIASVDLPIPDPTSVPIVGDHLASVVDWFEETVAELPDVPDQLEVDIPLHWEFDRPPVLDPLVSGVSVDSRFAQGGSSAYRANGPVATSNVPVVPLDAHPVVAFDQNIGVPSHVEFGGFSAGVVERFMAGQLAFRPMLRSIRLLQLPAEQFIDGTSENWIEIASTDASADTAEALWGLFRPQGEFSDQARASRRLLELWGTNPFEFLSRSIPMSIPSNGLVEPGTISPLDGLGLGEIEWCLEGEPVRHCVGQNELAVAHKVGRPSMRFVDGSSGWGYVFGLRGLTFRALDVRITDLGEFVALELDSPNRRAPFGSIDFPETVVHIELRILGKHVDVRADRRNVTIRQTVGTTLVETPTSVDTRVDDKVTVVTIDAPNGLDRLRLGARDTIRLVEVCWINADSVEAAAISHRECETNAAVMTRSSDPGVVLSPGMHYRIDIETSVELDEDASTALNEVTPELPRFPLTALPGFAEVVERYRVEDNGPVIESDTFHFQTAGPPADLNPYVKWTSPARSAARHFANDDFVIRFNRPYIHRLFADEDNGAPGPDGSPYALAAIVEDAHGRIRDDWFLNWTNAASSTLLPEEAHWFENIAPQNGSSIIPAPDDILEVRRSLHVIGFDAVHRWAAATNGPTPPRRRVKWKHRDHQVDLTTFESPAIHRYHMTEPTWESGHLDVEIVSARLAGVVVMAGINGRYEVRVEQFHDRRTVEIVRVRLDTERTLATMKIGLRTTPYQLAVNFTQADVGIHIAIMIGGKELEVTDLVPVYTRGVVGLLASGDATFRHFSMASSEPPLQTSCRYTLRLVGGTGGRLLRDDPMLSGPAEWWTDVNGWNAGTTGIKANGPARLQLNEPIDDGEFFIELSLQSGSTIRTRLRTPDSRRVHGDTAEYGLTLSRTGTIVNCALAVDSRGSSQLIASSETSMEPTDRIRLRVRLIGDRLSVWIGHDQVLYSTLDGDARQGGLGLVAVGGGITVHLIQVREVDLLALPFTTAAHSSFISMVDAIEDAAAEPVVSSEASETIRASIDSVLPSQQAWADAVLTLHVLERSAALHRTPRDELENQRQMATAAARALDESIRDLLEVVGAGLLVVPAEPSIQRVASSNGDAVAWLIRSPHPLDPVVQSKGSIDGLPSTGRTEFTLVDTNGDDVLVDWVSSVDGTTVLVFGASAGGVEGTQLRVVRLRDHQDDLSTINHLLDRPYELSRGDRTPIIRTINLPPS